MKSISLKTISTALVILAFSSSCQKESEIDNPSSTHKAQALTKSISGPDVVNILELDSTSGDWGKLSSHLITQGYDDVMFGLIDPSQNVAVSFDIERNGRNVGDGIALYLSHNDSVQTLLVFTDVDNKQSSIIYALHADQNANIEDDGTCSVSKVNGTVLGQVLYEDGVVIPIPNASDCEEAMQEAIAVTLVATCLFGPGVGLVTACLALVPVAMSGDC
jgi:hypothetical protein